MKFRTRLAAAVIGAITTSAVCAQAQVPMWGTGYNMGQQPCVYQVKAGDGTSSSDDEVKELKAALKEEKTKLKDLNSRERRIEKNLDNDQDVINGYFKDQFAAVIVNHISNQLECNDVYYSGTPPPPAPVTPAANGVDYTTENKGTDGGNQPKPSNDSGNGGGSSSGVPAPLPKYAPFSAAEWGTYCGPKKGTMNPQVCSATTRFVASGTDHKNQNDCKRALADFVRDQADENKIEDQISAAKDKIDRYENRDIPDAKDQAKADKEDDDTEGGICIHCMAMGNGGLPSTTNLIAAGIDATAAGLLYYGERSNQKMVAQYNSSIGYPTYNTTSGVGPAMLGIAAVNALTSGSGQGAYGCSASGAAASGAYGGNGAFGYPSNMFGMPNGGGMYNPMTGTWGAAGPWGLQGNPYTTGVGGYPYGAGGGYPYPGGGGYPFGAAGGYPYGAGAGGFPYGGGPAGGFGLGYGQGGLGGGYLGNGYGTAGQNGFGYGGNNWAAENSAAANTTQQGLMAEMNNLAGRVQGFNAFNSSAGVIGAGGGYQNSFGTNGYVSGYMSPYASASGYYGGGSGISGYLGVNIGGGSSYMPGYSPGYSAPYGAINPYGATSTGTNIPASR